MADKLIAVSRTSRLYHSLRILHTKKVADKLNISESENIGVQSGKIEDCD